MLTNTIEAIYFQTETGSESTIGCVAVIVIIAVVAIVISNQKNKALAQARAAYQQSLARLKSNPTNANLRENALSFGREYSNLTRNKRGVTVFDEVALMNDIGAACASAGNRPQDINNQPAPLSIEERLVRLSDLCSKGLIDDDEYGKRRQKIIDEI